jgi:glucose/arabinose dehydrogenase
MKIRHVLSGIMLLIWLLASLPAAAEPLPPGVSVDVYATYDSGYPTAMAWAPDGGLAVSTKEGRLYRVPPGGGEASLWLDLAGIVFTDGEQGLIGVAFDPLYPAEPYVYVYYTTRIDDVISNRVVRYRDLAGQLVDAFVLLDVPRVPEDVPCAWHVAGNLHFDAQGYLYVTIGDYGCNAGNAQGRHTPKGKVLRLNVRSPYRAQPNAARGAPGNMPCTTFATVGPPDNRLYACGFRNPFDFAFDSVTGYLFATENGPGCNDEVNLVLSGANYGWPHSATSYYDCRSLPPPYTEPIYVYPEPIGIAGIELFNSHTLPAWRHHLLWCANRTNTLFHAPFATAAFDALAPGSGMPVDGVSCPTDLSMGPDGRLYVLGFGVVRVLTNQACTLPWDLDSNHVVEVGDVQQMVGLWGLAWWDGSYDARYDMNFDGEIDAVDVQAVSSHWGESCLG